VAEEAADIELGRGQGQNEQAVSSSFRGSDNLSCPRNDNLCKGILLRAHRIELFAGGNAHRQHLAQYVIRVMKIHGVCCYLLSLVDAFRDSSYLFS
jgi:hypothetical protein